MANFTLFFSFDIDKQCVSLHYVLKYRVITALSPPKKMPAKSGNIDKRWIGAANRSDDADPDVLNYMAHPHKNGLRQDSGNNMHEVAIWADNGCGEHRCQLIYATCASNMSIAYTTVFRAFQRNITRAKIETIQ